MPNELTFESFRLHNGVIERWFPRWNQWATSAHNCATLAELPEYDKDRPELAALIRLKLCDACEGTGMVSNGVDKETVCFNCHPDVTPCERCGYFPATLSGLHPNLCKECEAGIYG